MKSHSRNRISIKLSKAIVKLKDLFIPKLWIHMLFEQKTIKAMIKVLAFTAIVYLLYNNLKNNTMITPSIFITLFGTWFISTFKSIATKFIEKKIDSIDKDLELEDLKKESLKLSNKKCRLEIRKLEMDLNKER